MSSDLFFYTSLDDEDEVNSELAVFAKAFQAAYEASKPKIHRTPVERDHYGAHDRLVMAYFFENPQYNEKTFRERFRMSRRLFTKIVREVTDASQWFQERYDCMGQRSISALMKCTFAVRQLAYGCVPDSLDEYLQMVAFKAQFCRGDHGPDPFILLKAIASNDLWIWHAFFGVSGMNNDVNVLRQSTIFNDLKSGRALDVPFVANDVPYKRGYYLTDGIYPQWSILIKSIKNPGTNDHKRILYKTKHEAASKDVKRAFGVLKKWKIIKYPARGLTQSRLSDIMYTCLTLDNMIIHDKGKAICPDYFPEEQHRADDPVRTHAESMQYTQEIIDRTAHLSLKPI
nr:protein ALP1-like [Tanacetum cinerariifolium]